MRTVSVGTYSIAVKKKFSREASMLQFETGEHPGSVYAAFRKAIEGLAAQCHDQSENSSLIKVTNLGHTDTDIWGLVERGEYGATKSIVSKKTLGPTHQQTVDEAAMEPAYFRGMQLLEDLFLPGWKHEVPGQAYAGAALSWSFYAQRAPKDEQRTNYVLAGAGDPAPEGALRVASNDEAALYVLDEARWESHRRMQPAGSQGRALYAVPRDLLFHRQRAFQRYQIIDVKGLISKKDPP